MEDLGRKRRIQKVLAKIEDKGEFLFLKREDLPKHGFRRTYLNKGGPGEVLCNKRRTCEFSFFVLKGGFERFLEFRRKNKEFQLKTNHEIEDFHSNEGNSI